MKLKINNSVLVNEPKWADIDLKAQKELLKDDPEAAAEYFADGEEFAHHYIKDGEMFIHAGGLMAAAAALVASKGEGLKTTIQDAGCSLLKHFDHFGIPSGDSLIKISKLVKGKKKTDDDEMDDDECDKNKKKKADPSDDDDDEEPDSDPDDEGGEDDTKKKIAERLKTFKYPQKFASIELMKKASGCKLAFAEDGATFILHHGVSGVDGSGSPRITQNLGIAKAAAFGSKGGSNADFTPTDDEWAKMQSFMPNQGTTKVKDNFKVYYLTAADTRLDRHSTKFAIQALKTGAKTGTDNPHMKDHNYYNSDGVKGKIFEAKAIKNGDTTFLMLKSGIEYNEANKAFCDSIENGSNNKLSIGCRIERSHLICDICEVPNFGPSWSWCGHYPGYECEVKGKTIVATSTYIDMVELLECSTVTVPAQPFAAIRDHQKAFENLSKAVAAPEIPEVIIQANGALEDPATIQLDTSKGDLSVDELKKLLTELLEAQKLNAKGNQEFITELKSQTEALKKEHQVQLDDLKQQVEKSSAEFQSLFAAHKSLVGKIDEMATSVKEASFATKTLVGRSIVEIERTVALTKAQPETRRIAYARKQAEGNEPGNWDSFADQTYTDEELKQYRTEPQR